ncbi:MAG: 30S ribosomal protein S6 [Halanaerobiales bacterium]
MMAVEKNYETTFVLKSDLEDEEKEEIMDRIKNVITDGGGEINEIDVWGERRLAYEIRDYRSGHYTVIDFTGPTDIVEDLQHYFKVIDGVLRSLVVNLED